MHRVISLTVSESKRLIAKGVAATDHVRRALETGTVAVLPGTTNGYVIEELTGKPFDKPRYVAGRTLPAGFGGEKPTNTSTGLVIRRGERLAVKAKEAVAEMGPGDVLIKGVNALNYERRQAGVLIGHPMGRNVGVALGTVVSRRIRYFLPVGLEKSVPGDIFTEIEAIATLARARAVPAGAGGIGGAEGAVWLAIFGDDNAMERTEALIDSIRGEEPFLDP